MPLTDKQIKEVKDRLSSWIPYIKERHGFKYNDQVKIHIEGDQEVLDLIADTKSSVLSRIKATEVFQKSELTYRDTDPEEYNDDIILRTSEDLNLNNKKIVIRITK